MLLTEIYHQLRNDNVCKNESDFSTRFLNKSNSYYSVYKTRNTKPNVTVLLNLETALLNTAHIYSNNNYPYFIRTRRHLITLSTRVNQYRKQLACFSHLLKSHQH